MNDAKFSRIYKPLHPWQTRLGELFAAETGTPLRCSLHVADVIASDGFGLPETSRTVRYEALSYS